MSKFTKELAAKVIKAAFDAGVESTVEGCHLCQKARILNELSLMGVFQEDEELRPRNYQREGIMERYFLELLLIAEKDKIDEYVKYTEKDGEFNKDDKDICLGDAFAWKSTKEGYRFWSTIFYEAEELSGEW